MMHFYIIKKMSKKEEETFNLLAKNPTPGNDDNIFREIFYNCTECSSLIEILLINKYNIKFRCIKGHIISMQISEYLEEMKKYNNKEINKDICPLHLINYVSYCFNCNKHLCSECLKQGGILFIIKIVL